MFVWFLGWESGRGGKRRSVYRGRRGFLYRWEKLMTPSAFLRNDVGVRPRSQRDAQGEIPGGTALPVLTKRFIFSNDIFLISRVYFSSLDSIPFLVIL